MLPFRLWLQYAEETHRFEREEAPSVKRNLFVVLRNPNSCHEGTSSFCLSSQWFEISSSSVQGTDLFSIVFLAFFREEATQSIRHGLANRTRVCSFVGLNQAKNCKWWNRDVSSIIRRAVLVLSGPRIPPSKRHKNSDEEGPPLGELKTF